ncbi:MAG: response regulator transcription factor [Planctomycetales bacterium]|nr:response regulator transcription factor [Planctomycetales bacterium]
MAINQLIYVVDDYPAIAEVAKRYLLAAGGFEVRTFTSARDLLHDFVPNTVDCVVADLKMPGLDGGELHLELAQQDPSLSFVFVTGFADVKTAVKLMEQGAFTLLEKPFSAEDLVVSVRRAVEQTSELRAKQSQREQAATLLSTLTEDERDVMECMVAGLPNKTIANKLALSSRTVDRRRHAVLTKMQVSSVPELAALVARLDLETPAAN